MLLKQVPLRMGGDAGEDKPRTMSWAPLYVKKLGLQNLPGLESVKLLGWNAVALWHVPWRWGGGNSNNWNVSSDLWIFKSGYQRMLCPGDPKRYLDILDIFFKYVDWRYAWLAASRVKIAEGCAGAATGTYAMILGTKPALREMICPMWKKPLLKMSRDRVRPLFLQLRCVWTNIK